MKLIIQNNIPVPIEDLPVGTRCEIVSYENPHKVRTNSIRRQLKPGTKLVTTTVEHFNDVQHLSGTGFKFLKTTPDISVYSIYRLLLGEVIMVKELEDNNEL